MIVIGHTRELAFQISKEYARFGKYLPQGTPFVLCCFSL